MTFKCNYRVIVSLANYPYIYTLFTDNFNISSITPFVQRFTPHNWRTNGEKWKKSLSDLFHFSPSSKWR